MTYRALLWKGYKLYRSLGFRPYHARELAQEWALDRLYYERKNDADTIR